MKKISSSSILTRIVFKTAFAIKKLYVNVIKSNKINWRLPIVDLVFKQIKNAFGGNVEFIISGSSALPDDARLFLEVCSGARISCGYGLSECSSVGSFNYCG